MNAWAHWDCRQRLLDVARDYCADLKTAADAENGVSLLDEVAAEEVVGSVDDPEKRRMVGQLMLAVLDADRRHCAEELIVYSSIAENPGATNAGVEAAARGRPPLRDNTHGFDSLRGLESGARGRHV